MRKVRALIVLFFAAVCAVFCIYKVKEMINRDVQAPVITSKEETLEISIQAEEKICLQD